MSIAWNEENAAHLFRRAAFGATREEISQALADGLETTVEKLILARAPNDLLDSRINRAGFYLQSDGLLSDLARWWLIRMIYTARPLEERMTLFWHNHFATAYAKVLHIGWLKSENETIRAYGLGRFRDLVLAVAKDTAMMYWLDSWLNTKTNLNENFGRELLELFTLGRGHYQESDVLSSARAFTGWSFNGTTAEFIFLEKDHDFSEKVFLGRTGTWNGDDIIRMACDEDAHASFIVAKLFAYFAYENPEPAVLDRFVGIYRDSDTNISIVVQAILTSAEMYSDKALWSKVKSPIDHVVMASRQLALADDVPTAFRYLAQQGQTPFDPPDVSGWDGGVKWINPGALINRMNFSDAAARQFDPLVFTADDSIGTAAGLVDLYLQRLGPLHLAPETRATLVSYLSPDGILPSGETLVSRQRGLCRMILSMPEWQVH